MSAFREPEYLEVLAAKHAIAFAKKHVGLSRPERRRAQKRERRALERVLAEYRRGGVSARQVAASLAAFDQAMRAAAGNGNVELEVVVI